MEDIEVYLPSGEIWYKDDRCYTGGQTVALHIPATGTVPYFVRGGCVFPLDIGPTGFQKPSRVQFTVYPIADGTFQSRYFDDDGHTYAYRDGHCVDAGLYRCLCCRYRYRAGRKSGRHPLCTEHSPNPGRPPAADYQVNPNIKQSIKIGCFFYENQKKFKKVLT